MQRSLQKARHNKGKKFNRFACKIAWPPVSSCNPWSERNLWSKLRYIAGEVYETLEGLEGCINRVTLRLGRHILSQAQKIAE